MPWHCKITKSYGALTTAQKKENVLMFFNYFNGYMTLQAMAGILGNIERESQLNPGQIEGDSQYNVGWDTIRRGHGFIQWTGGKNGTNPLLDWKGGKINDKWADGDFQCYRIKCEGENTEGAGGTFFPKGTYRYTWKEFCALTDVEEATKAYLHERERAGVAALDDRITFAKKWFDFLSNNTEATGTFTPRLDNKQNLMNNKIWIATSYGGYNACVARKDFSDFTNSASMRAKYPEIVSSGTVLPNCTGYAWGRAHELLGGDPSNKPTLSTRNAGRWFSNTVDGYARSTSKSGEQAVPKEGAIACWRSVEWSAAQQKYIEAAGHVAVVEKIVKNDAGIITGLVLSESGYTGGFKYPPNYYWISGEIPIEKFKIGAARWTNVYFQGFIYLPNVGGAPSVALPTISRPEVIQIYDTGVWISVKFISGEADKLFCTYYQNIEEETTIEIDLNSVSENGDIHFKLNNLLPNTNYTFYITAKNSGGATDSVKITFKTHQSLPGSVKNLKLVNTSERNLPSSLFETTFKPPADWGYWDRPALSETKGYKIYLIANGELLNYREELSVSNETESFTFIANNFLGKSLKTGDTLQIGVQPFIQPPGKTKIYGEIACSNAIYLRENDFNIYLRTLVNA